MAIIFSYPQINLSSISADDLMIISDMNTDGRPTKALKLSDLATFITNTGTGSGTTNKITKWTDGASGVLGDSSITDTGTQISMSSDFTINSNGGNNAKFITDWGDHRVSILDAAGAYTFTAADLDGGGKIGVNKQIPSTTLHVGGTGTFDSSLSIPLIPTANAHATSKQYVDQQIASIPAGLVFQGNWNANTNTPTLASGTGTVGNYYVVSVAGNTNLDGITDWEVGDWAVFVEVGGVDKWDKIDQTFVQGAGATGQVSFWNGINSVTGDNDLYWDNANKRLGVGTTSPSKKLEIKTTATNDGLLFSTGAPDNLNYANVFNSNSNAFPVGNISLSYGSSSSALINAQSNSMLLRGGTNATGYIRFNSFTTEIMRMTDVGLGIGTTSPAHKLTIEDNAATDAVRILNTDSNGGGLSVYAANGGGGTNRILTLGDAALNIKVAVIENGNVGIGTSSPAKKLDVTVDTSDDGVILQTVSGRKALEALVDNGTNGQGKIHFYTGANLLHGRIMADTNGLNITQLATDKDIIFQADDGGGGVDTYFSVVGAGNRVQYNKNLRLIDNVRASFGSSDDLAIYHNGTTNNIEAINGKLRLIQTEDDGDISFESDDGAGGITEYFRVDGSNEYNLFSKQARFLDSVEARFGTGGDFRFYHSGSTSFMQNFTGDIRIINYATDGDIAFYSDDGSGGETTYFYLDGSLADGTYNYTRWNDGGVITFGGDQDLRIWHDPSNSSSYIRNYTNDLYIENTADDKDIIFKNDDGSGGTTEYFRLDGGFGSPQTIFPDNSQLNFGNGLDLRIVHDGSNSTIESNGTGDLIIQQKNDDKDIIFKCDDGSGGLATYFTLDGSLTQMWADKNLQFSDNIKAKFGASSDLEIFHQSSSSNSFIQNNTGNLRIINNTDDGDITFECDDGSGGITNYLKLWGAIESVAVYKDVLMVNDGNGGKLKFGASQDLQIYHDGSNSYIDQVGTGDLIIRTSGTGDDIFVRAMDDIFIQPKNGDAGVYVFGDGAVELYYDGNKKLETTSTGIKTTGQMDLAALNTAVTNSDDNGNLGEIRFTADYIYVCVADDTWKRVALSTW